MVQPDPIIAEIEASDRFLGPLMTSILACLCEKASEAPNPPRHCAFRVGTEALHDTGIDEDMCCSGIAYVMLGDIYASSNSFPEEDIVRQAQTACAPATWGVEFKVGLVRCIPVGGTNVITDDQWNRAALQNIYDARTLMKAACCMRDYVVRSNGVLLGMSSIIGRHTQANPLGGCVERFFTFTAQLPNCDC